MVNRVNNQLFNEDESKQISIKGNLLMIMERDSSLKTLSMDRDIDASY